MYQYPFTVDISTHTQTMPQIKTHKEIPELLRTSRSLLTGSCVEFHQNTSLHSPHPARKQFHIGNEFSSSFSLLLLPLLPPFIPQSLCLPSFTPSLPPSLNPSFLPPLIPPSLPSSLNPSFTHSLPPSLNPPFPQSLCLLLPPSLLTLVTAEIMTLSGCSPVTSETTNFSPKSQKICLQQKYQTLKDFPFAEREKRPIKRLPVSSVRPSK